VIKSVKRRKRERRGEEEREEKKRRRGIEKRGKMKLQHLLKRKNKKARNLSKNRPYLIYISLDGADEKTHDLIRGEGSFKKALEGIKNIVEVGLLGEIMFTLNRLNINEVPKIIDLAVKLGARRIGIERIVPIWRGKGMKDSVLTQEELHKTYLYIAKKKQELKDKIIIATNRPLWCLIGKELQCGDFSGSCAAGFSTLTVLPNGDVMPCRRMNLVIGNVTSSSP